MRTDSPALQSLYVTLVLKLYSQQCIMGEVAVNFILK